jgi:hypothetical protein
VVAQHLAVVLVYDLPDSMAFVTRELLETWDIGFDDVLELAIENLAAKPLQLLRHPEVEVYIMAAHDGYDATRLLLSDRLSQVSVEGDMVIMPIRRDLAVITGTDDTEGLQGMLKIAAAGGQESYPVAMLAFRLDDGDWVPWLPDPGNALYNDFKTLECHHFGLAYREQARLLENAASAGQPAEPCLYAPLLVKPDGTNVFSLTGMGPELPVALPKADLLAFHRAPLAESTPENIYILPWDEAVEILAEAIHPLDVYPERYLVKEFPDGDAWRRLTEARRR